METEPQIEVEVLLQKCLKELDPMEAAYVEGCCLAEPKVSMKTFAQEYRLKPKEVVELRDRALGRMKEELAAKGVCGVGDVF